MSTCPIRHPLWLSMSCGSQGYSAFNAVVAAFPWIFLGFLPYCMFMRHVPIIGASWRVILTVGIDIWAAFIISEEQFLLGPPSFRSLLMRLQIGTPNNYLFLLGPFNVLRKNPMPNIWSWAFILTIVILTYIKLIRLDDEKKLLFWFIYHVLTWV